MPKQYGAPRASTAMLAAEAGAGCAQSPTVSNALDSPLSFLPNPTKQATQQPPTTIREKLNLRDNPTQKREAQIGQLHIESAASSHSSRAPSAAPPAITKASSPVVQKPISTSMPEITPLPPRDPRKSSMGSALPTPDDAHRVKEQVMHDQSLRKERSSSVASQHSTDGSLHECRLIATMSLHECRLIVTSLQRLMHKDLPSLPFPFVPICFINIVVLL